MSRAIFRYEVPVDDQWHPLTLSGLVLCVGCRQSDTVEFWAITSDETDATDSEFRVFATGQPLDPDATYLGTAVTPSAYLVWHLFQRPAVIAS